MCKFDVVFVVVVVACKLYILFAVASQPATVLGRIHNTIVSHIRVRTLIFFDVKCACVWDSITSQRDVGTAEAR